MSPVHVDILIVGGGPVGATLALSLQASGQSVMVVEAIEDFSVLPGYDQRTIAISQSSQQMLAAVGVWCDLPNTPIQHIHVSQKGFLGTSTIHAEDYDVPSLGYTVRAGDLGRAFQRQVAECDAIDWRAPARVVKVVHHANYEQVTVKSADVEFDVHANLVVAADGKDSSVRQLLNLPVKEKDYKQVALVAKVVHEKTHNNVAYERFSDEGPMAFLPLDGRKSAMVWTMNPDKAEVMKGLDDKAFLQRFQQRFGYRLGRLQSIEDRASYPLALVHASEPYQQRCVLIGNAAHSLHPVSGQGLNLGLRDVAELVELLTEHGSTVEPAVLAAFMQKRQKDHQRVVVFTDGLIRLFGAPMTLVGHLRGVGLIAFDAIPLMKRVFAKFTMGLWGRLPKLTRGILPNGKI